MKLMYKIFKTESNDGSIVGYTAKIAKVGGCFSLKSEAYEYWSRLRGGTFESKEEILEQIKLEWDRTMKSETLVEEGEIGC